MSAPAVLAPRATRWADRGLTAVIAGLLALLVIGVALRATSTSVMVDYTDSMRPAISAGDVVVDRPVRATDLHRGEVATIADPALHRTVTHRVVSVTRTGTTVTVVTRGDANDASERWVLPANASVRHMVARIPWIGHLMVWLASPLLRALLLALGALATAAWGINRLRRA